MCNGPNILNAENHMFVFSPLFSISFWFFSYLLLSSCIIREFIPLTSAARTRSRGGVGGEFNYKIVNLN